MLDKTTGDALIGVNVKVKGTGDGTITTVKGATLKAPSSSLTNVNNHLSFDVKGTGVIAAVGNADLKDTDSYVGHQRKAWKGRAIVVLKSTQKKGKIVLKVTSPGLIPATVTVRTNK